ncbi:MAG: hypothetical protein OEL83_03490 [Desulforhopalus sp.]|nr:hypothetical protein [Desulforhopalus sp.]
MQRTVKRILAVLLTPLMILLNCPVMAASPGAAQPAKPTTEIVHKALARAEAGKRLTVYTEIADPKGVDVVRAYFKARDAADYSFIALNRTDHLQGLATKSGRQSFAGVLPAPADHTKAFEYLILVKNKANVVVKSQTYSVTVVDGIADMEEQEPLQVYTELAQAPDEIAGFSDNIVYDAVESAGKLGVVAGLYAGIQAGGGGAVNGGTVAASSNVLAAADGMEASTAPGNQVAKSGVAEKSAAPKAAPVAAKVAEEEGLSATQIVIGSVALLAVAGGVVALASGGGDDSSSNGDTAQPLDSTTILGAWNFTGRHPATGCTVSGSKSYAVDGSLSQSNVATACPTTTSTATYHSGGGNWTFQRSVLTEQYVSTSPFITSLTLIMRGTPSGNSAAFTISLDTGWEMSYRR